MTPGQDVAIAVFKNDDSVSISLSLEQKTEAWFTIRQHEAGLCAGLFLH